MEKQFLWMQTEYFLGSMSLDRFDTEKRSYEMVLSFSSGPEMSFPIGIEMVLFIILSENL